MPLRTIKLNLKNTSYFQPKQVEDTDINATYDQMQQMKQPKVLHQVNCIPLQYGVKSADIFSSVISSTVYDETGTATVLNLGPSTELTTMIDVNGNLWYMLLDKQTSSPFTTDIYLRRAANNTQFQKYATLSNTTRYEYNIFTVFQNSTLFAGLPTTTIHSPNTIIPHPDATGPANGTFYNIDITAGTVISNELLNIGVDVLDSVQCVTSFNNYMLLFTRNTLYWSCPTDPYDFTPVESTGGGGSTKISEARGDILAVLPSSTGFIVYCRMNIVVGSFTGNTRQPWKFKEIKGSSGLIVNNEEALVVKNETSEVHYAFLVGGMSIVTENSVNPVGENLRKFLTSDFIETRVSNSGRLKRDTAYSTQGAPETKIKRMYSYGTKLFFLIEVVGALPNRLYIYDISDDSIGVLFGDYLALCPRLTQEDSTSTLFLQQKVSAVTDSFILLKRVNASPQELSFEVLDFGTRSNIPVITGNASNTVAEFLIGDISISPSRSTILHTIKLEGRLDISTPDEGGDLAASTTKVRVFAYSSYFGESSLMEFVYNVDDNTYHGYIEGPDIRILVQGDYFFLTGLELKVDSGNII